MVILILFWWGLKLRAYFFSIRKPTSVNVCISSIDF